jgi:alpha-galactosidase
MITRRSFLCRTAATSVVAGADAFAHAGNGVPHDSTYLDLMRSPDAVTVFSGLDQSFALDRSGPRFTGKDVVVTANVQESQCAITVAASSTRLTHLRLRWRSKVSSQLLFLGDHWERSYGDLAWRGMTPERVMPWYFATYDRNVLHCYGVKTAPRALCFWQADPDGVSLWLDVSNGGNGVLLGARELAAATVVARRGAAGESPIPAMRDFCKRMCPRPVLPRGAVYGGNDWYTAYGKNSQEMLLRIADLIADVSPAQGERPFTVVDMGWKENSSGFPSMAAYAEQVRKRGVRPGIWIRPLEADAATDGRLLLPAKRYGKRSERYSELAFDPTIPDALELVKQKVRQTADWNFDLVKHDFSTYDMFGQWGFEMGAQPTIPGWTFHDRSRTNAEIVLDFYKFLRETLGEMILILGCNTVGHLGAGIFELQRTGDDTSGRIWERTRRMGVNTLAYRLPQHQTFFHLDADCVGITREIPWMLNSQWLDVVARSHTTLFVSPEEGVVGEEQRAALKEAFALVSATRTNAPPAAEPSDFFHDTTPETWSMGNGKVKQYRWCEQEGAFPFVV